MKKIDFKKVRAKNFFCYGKDGIEIDFKKYGNVVVINGRNLDIQDEGEENKHSSNGVGKSSIIDALVYGLYGKTVKNPVKIKQADIINNVTSKQMEVEVCWDDYKVIRTRKPDGLRFWKGADEITLGGMPATQKEIENILGLNYDTFVNICVFTDDNSVSFLECDTAKKREIVENLLSLEKYRSYNENTKKMLKEHKENIKVKDKDLSYLEQTLKDARSSIESLESSQKLWKKTKEDEIKKLEQTILLINAEIEKLKKDDESLKKYLDAQDKIKELEKKIEETDNLKNKAETALESTQKKYDSEKQAKGAIDNEVYSLEQEKSRLSKQIIDISKNIDKLKSLEPGVKCNHCHSTIDSSNYQSMLDSHMSEVLELKTKTEEKIVEIKLKNESLSVFNDSITKLAETIAKLKTGIANALNTKKNAVSQIETYKQVKKPESETKIRAYENKKETLEEQIKDKSLEIKGTDPYQSLLDEAKTKFINTGKEVGIAKEEISNLNSKTKYFEFWSQAFGDTGIRKYVIDEIVPALNNNINYWMQFLIEGNMQINFNNEFEETILKAPSFKDDIQYYALSSGQKRRVNLALSQSFAHIMSLNSGRTPNLVFLDEVTSNIDLQGVNGIISMIQELAKDKQVWLITHHHDLLDALQSSDSIHLELKNGVSTLVKI